MARQTKNIITRETVADELARKNSLTLRIIIIPSAFLLFLCVLIMLGIYGSLSGGGYSLAGKIMIILLSFALTAPIIFLVLVICSILGERKMLYRGEFELEVSKLIEKKEKLVRRHLDECLVFKGYKDFSVGHTIYQLAAAGDEYYLVHYRGKKSVQLVYPASMYEYKENR